MPIYNPIYKKLYPIKCSTEIKEIEEEERQLLANVIRDMPVLCEHWRTKAFNAFMDGKRVAQRYSNCPRDILQYQCDELADRVLSGSDLSKDEVSKVNFILKASRFNWFCKNFLYPF